MHSWLIGFLVALALVAQSPTPVQPAATAAKPYDCSATEHRQFDFWIGDWDVVTNPATASPSATPPSSGRKPARNMVQKAHDGCVLIENWDDGIGGTGQSFNLFDRQTRRWHQTWVDNGGGLHEYWGELKDGHMVFRGEVPLGPAQRFAGRRTVRLTFSPMGSDKVRQFSESLGTDGKWTVNYDLIYTRRASR
jgi:hypothetical protein